MQVQRPLEGNTFWVSESYKNKIDRGIKDIARK